LARRFASASLAKGWTSWCEYAVARAWATAHLRRVANMLRAPLLAGPFDAWAREWRDVRMAEALEEQAAAHERSARLEVASLRSELEQAREEAARREAELTAETAAALERQRVELVGSANEQAALKAKEERSARIELVRRQVALVMSKC